MAMEPEVNAVPSEQEPEEKTSDAESSVPAALKKKIDACKRVRRNLANEWSINIDYRRGKHTMEDSDVTRNVQAIDWSYTKSKQTQLYSATPEVIVEYDGSGQSPYKVAAPVFQRRLNRRIRDAKVHIAMDEVMSDLINAAGMGVIMVLHDVRTEMREVPQFDETKLTLMQQMQQKLGLFQNPKVSVPFVTDRRFKCTRVSPVDLIWDTTFTGSDFDEMSLIGRSGRLLWAEAKRKFKLEDAEKDALIGDDRTDQELLTHGFEEKRDEDAV